MTSGSSKTLKKTSSTEIDMEPLMEYKVFNDPIHGTVSLHPLLVNIIDTPQFQRLRNIKQLGGGYFVYPGASHNRFEHSIGVAHLAGELVKALKTKQTELKIDDRDVLCVQIAGLCHDLGHGPFSHLFEMFINQTRPDKGWKHEEASLKMFDHMVEWNHLEEKMKEHGLDPSSDVDFIKELIKGWSPVDPKPEGRPNKLFLYEIVANKRNGIDVDKFDYLARDAHHLGIKESFDHLRFIQFARVCDVDGVQQICTRDKEVNNLYDLFHLRYLLHRRAYQHKVNKIIESMIIEAFVKADKHIKIEGFEAMALSEAIDNMEAYTKLTDDVFGQILHSSTKGLKAAREILSRIVSRQHYRFLGETKPTEDMITKGMTPRDVENMKLRWKKELAKACDDDTLKPDDFEVHIVNMDYGMKDEDPIKKVRFYSKSDRTKGVPLNEDQEFMFKPTCFSEQLIRIYWTKIDKATQKIDETTQKTDETTQKIDKTTLKIDEAKLRKVREHVSRLCQGKKWPNPEVVEDPVGDPVRDPVRPEPNPAENIQNNE